jgi:hypothetical protein
LTQAAVLKLKHQTTSVPWNATYTAKKSARSFVRGCTHAIVNPVQCNTGNKNSARSFRGGCMKAWLCVALKSSYKWVASLFCHQVSHTSSSLTLDRTHCWSSFGNNSSAHY